jgi:hypothetical protein
VDRKLTALTVVCAAGDSGDERNRIKNAAQTKQDSEGATYEVRTASQ